MRTIESLLVFSTFLAFSCVIDTYATQFMTSIGVLDKTSQHSRYRFHERNALLRRLLGRRTLQFMDGKSLCFPLIEVLGAAYLTLSAHVYGLFSREMFICAAGSSAIFVAALVDQVEFFFPDEITYSFIGLGVLLVIADATVDTSDAANRLLGALMAWGIVYLLFYRLYRVVRGVPGFGLGDVKLCIGVGLFVGPLNFVAFFLLSAVLGTIFAVFSLVAFGRVLGAPSERVRKELFSEGYMPPEDQEPSTSMRSQRLATGPFYATAFGIVMLAPNVPRSIFGYVH